MVVVCLGCTVLCINVHSMVHECAWSCWRAFGLSKFEAVQGLRLSGVSDATPSGLPHHSLDPICSTLHEPCTLPAAIRVQELVTRLFALQDGCALTDKV
jgi:hypothetical protein